MAIACHFGFSSKCCKPTNDMRALWAGLLVALSASAAIVPHVRDQLLAGNSPDVYYHSNAYNIGQEYFNGLPQEAAQWLAHSVASGEI